MVWTVQHADVLAIPADVLICSANVFLNLSGGVGGEILLRYGDDMQRHLHRWLSDQRKRFVDRGEVVVSPGFKTPFKFVLHAVAVDAFYGTSREVIEAVVSKSLSVAAGLDARTVALVALGTGFGRLSICEFAKGVAPLLTTDYPPLELVTICVRKDVEAQQVREALEGNRE